MFSMSESKRPRRKSRDQRQETAARTRDGSDNQKVVEPAPGPHDHGQLSRTDPDGANRPAAVSNTSDGPGGEAQDKLLAERVRLHLAGMTPDDARPASAEFTE